VWYFVILTSTWAARDQFHDLLDIFLHSLKFPARQFQLGPGSGNYSGRSDGGHVFQVDMDQFAARFSQFDPNARFGRGATTEGGTLCEARP